MERLLVLHVGDRLLDIDALPVVDAAGIVGNRNDLRAIPRQRQGGFTADVAEPLYRDRRLGDRDLEILEVFFDEVGDARARRLATSLRTTERDRLARDDGRLVVADVI